MLSNLKKWAGTSFVVAGMTLAGAAAHGQDIQGDLWQYQRDQQQAYRDRLQLNRDIATGNTCGVLRDVRNLQADQQYLGLDQQNIQNDVRLLTNPYASGYGGCRTPSTYPSAYGGYPATSPAYPSAYGGYPATSPAYPPTYGGYPATSPAYPSTYGGYPSGPFPTQAAPWGGSPYGMARPQ